MENDGLDDNEIKLEMYRAWQAIPFSERFDLIARWSAEAYYRKHPEKLNEPPAEKLKVQFFDTFEEAQADAEDRDK